MYRHINRHIDAILGLLREKNHVQNYDNLVLAFAQPNAAVHEEFQRHYARFWALGPGVNNAWRQHYFNLLDDIRNGRQPALQQQRQLLEHVCRETLNNHRGGESLYFSFATKLVHMVDRRAPIYDDRVRAFYFLPHANNGGAIEPRIHRCLDAYDALVNEYDRIIANNLLHQSIVRFREELHPEEFTDIKIIDSLIWAFVTWAKRGAALVNGHLQYE